MEDTEYQRIVSEVQRAKEFADENRYSVCLLPVLIFLAFFFLKDAFYTYQRCLISGVRLIGTLRGLSLQPAVLPASELKTKMQNVLSLISSITQAMSELSTLIYKEDDVQGNPPSILFFNTVSCLLFSN